jgi:predicted O-methyltransferase YrrM
VTGSRGSARYVTYPRGRLYAVLDDPGAASRAVDALVRADVDAARVEVLRGDNAADTLDGTGNKRGIRGRVRRAIEFTLMDQAPDLAWYEAAIRDGRSVIAVRVSAEPAVRSAVNVLRSVGGHFINYYGRFATEEFERWHGPEPTLPDYLRR